MKFTCVVAGDFPTCNTGLGTVMGLRTEFSP